MDRAHLGRPETSAAQEVCHETDRRRRRVLSRSRASAARASRPRPGSSAVTASCAATRSSARSSAETTRAHAAPRNRFKRSCLGSGCFRRCEPTSLSPLNRWRRSTSTGWGREASDSRHRTAAHRCARHAQRVGRAAGVDLARAGGRSREAPELNLPEAARPLPLERATPADRPSRIRGVRSTIKQPSWKPTPSTKTCPAACR